MLLDLRHNASRVKLLFELRPTLARRVTSTHNKNTNTSSYRSPKMGYALRPTPAPKVTLIWAKLCTAKTASWATPWDMPPGIGVLESMIFHKHEF